jgi:DNA ligase-1
MEFATFAGYAREAEAASADHAVREHVTALLLEAGPDLPVVARYVQGRVFPAHDSTKLDVGPALCYAAIAKAAGRNVGADDVEARVAEVGDVGEVAAAYDFGSQQGLGAFATGDGGAESLTIAEVDESLRELAAVEGSGSEDTKRDLLFGLFNRADDDEARYLARLVLGEMRIGVGAGTVRDAIADAFEVPADSVERALQVTNDHGQVAVVARDEGEPGLDSLGLEVGRPVDAMLAQAGSVSEALEDWERAAVEWKYDGARVQVHYDGESVSLFSRNMEDVTDPLPEVVEFVERALDVPAILDGEVVAVAEDGSPLPFQEILRRFRRKHDVAKAREDVAVEFHAFDCLHANGTDLLGEPLSERHRRLTELLDDEPDAVSDLVVSEDADDIEAIESEALAAGHEGIMLKNPESAYTPGRRGKNWLKRKPDVETLDLVVTGAEWGEGRRANLLGTFLLSVRSGDDRFETIGKVATGITDEELAELTDLLEPHVRSEDGADLDIEPAVVFEVGYEEIQPSPTYSSGYALRFPRFLGIRDDKDPADADSTGRVERLVERQ